MTGVDWFAVEMVLDGERMNLTGDDLLAAAVALADRGETYATIADRCRIDERAARRAVDTGRKRLRDAARRTAA